MAAPPDTDDELAWVEWVQGEIKLQVVRDFFAKTQTGIVECLNRDKATFAMVYPHRGVIRIMQTYALAGLIRQCLSELPPSALTRLLHALVTDTIAGNLDTPSQPPAID